MTTAEWKKRLTDKFISTPRVIELYHLDPDKNFEEQFSKVSIESILFYTVAYGFMIIDKIIGDKIAELQQQFEALRPHTLQWYASKIKAFQINHTLAQDSDKYNAIDESAKVVKYCSLSEDNGILSAKIAGINDGRPTRLDGEIVAKVEEYISRVKDAGVRVLVSSGEADMFTCELLIHYDPLSNLSEGDIKRAISAYLESMQFDGVYSNMALIDALQKVDGVRVAELITSKAHYGGNLDTEIVSIYTPNSGYMALNSAIITLKPY